MDDFEKATAKILKAIKEIKTESKNEELSKLAIQYMVLKMCESEKTFNDNLRILDTYAANGLKNQKTKSLGSFANLPRRF